MQPFVLHSLELLGVMHSHRLRVQRAETQSRSFVVQLDMRLSGDTKGPHLRIRKDLMCMLAHLALGGRIVDEFSSYFALSLN